MTVHPAESIVEQYINNVIDGTVPACEWVIKATKRHLDDLENGHERGLWFDKDAAQSIISFYSMLRHSKGEWAGSVIVLEPWQQFILWVAFGWKNEDGTRRFRTGYVEVARKNGKSTMAAGVGNFLLIGDGEPGAEIYSAATTKDQAKIVHSEATRMVKSSPALRKRITVFRDNLNIPDTASKYEPISKDHTGQEGLNVHGAIVDELHAHKGREVWDVLETATGSRRNPFMLAITTAGFDRNTLCREFHDYTTKILNGIFEDDTWFGIIYTLDGWETQDTTERDDWEDENNWIKANPNLGVSKYWKDLRTKANRAREMPASLNTFLRKELNLWTQSAVKWINVEHWKLCGGGVDPEGLRGRTCYGGLDLSSNTDLSAFIKVFPPETEDGLYKILSRFWIPEDNVLERVKNDRVPYDVWIREGFIQPTPGNVIDYEFILAAIEEDMEAYDLKEIAFDPWGATMVQTKLMEMGGEDFLVTFRQGFASMAAPTRLLERWILGHRIAHGNNPVLTWMADNVVTREDPAGNRKPDKEKSPEKIDGIVGLIMAGDRADRREGPPKSVYADRGIRTL